MLNLFYYFRLTSVAVFLALAVSFSAHATEMAAVRIAVTLPPLAGLVSMLDKQAGVMCLLPAGADPHHFQLTPRKIEALARTDLLIRTSFDDGGWPLPPQHRHSLNLWPDIDHGWLSPQAVRGVLPKIADALIKLHPDQRRQIAASLQAALQQTDDIAQAWRTAIAKAGLSGVLMQHPSWRRLMQEMGVPVLAILESVHHGHEHGPHKLEHALKTLKQHPDAWLLADASHSSRALDWLAAHSKIKTQRIRLDALGACGESWPALMRRNIAKISAVAQP